MRRVDLPIEGARAVRILFCADKFPVRNNAQRLLDSANDFSRHEVVGMIEAREPEMIRFGLSLRPGLLWPRRIISPRQNPIQTTTTD